MGKLGNSPSSPVRLDTHQTNTNTHQVRRARAHAHGRTHARTHQRSDKTHTHLPFLKTHQSRTVKSNVMLNASFNFRVEFMWCRCHVSEAMHKNSLILARLCTWRHQRGSALKGGEKVRREKKKPQPRHRKVWTLTLAVKWRCLEVLATISFIPHTTEELLKASSTLGPSEKIPGVQKINRKRWRPHQHSCLCLVFTREAEASVELELERVALLKSGHLKMQDGKLDHHPSTGKTKTQNVASIFKLTFSINKKWIWI